MTGNTAKKILGRIVQKKQVEASVAIVIKKHGVGSEDGIGDSVARRLFGESPVLVVYEEEICPLLRLRPLGAGHGDIDVQVPVVVDVHHRSASGPSAGADARSLGDVLELEVPFVPVQATRDHVSGKEDVRQSIIIDVTDRHTGAVVHVDIGLNIERVVGGDGVRERYAGLLRGQELEDRVIMLGPGAGWQAQKGDQQREWTRMMHEPEPRRICWNEPTAVYRLRHQSGFRRVPNSVGDRRIGTGAEQTDAELWMVGNAPLMAGSR